MKACDCEHKVCRGPSGASPLLVSHVGIMVWIFIKADDKYERTYSSHCSREEVMVGDPNVLPLYSSYATGVIKKQVGSPSLCIGSCYPNRKGYLVYGSTRRHLIYSILYKPLEPFRLGLFHLQGLALMVGSI